MRKDTVVVRNDAALLVRMPPSMLAKISRIAKSKQKSCAALVRDWIVFMNDPPVKRERKP